jgi:dephospho-CoA kinase
MSWMISKERLKTQGIHASETSWVGTEFDAVLDNNGTLDHLYQQVMRLVQDLPGATASHS